MRLIGLSGYARTGKDSVADILVQQFGYERKAFADPLYRALTLMNPYIAYKGEFFPLQDLVAWHGWDAIKAHAPQARILLQRLGTEVGRRMLGENIWVDAAMRGLKPDGKYVITDCRFENEAQAILARDGLVVRVQRPGVGPANQHPSEISLDNWPFDVVIDNDGSLSDLADEVAGVLFRFDAAVPV